MEPIVVGEELCSIQDVLLAIKDASTYAELHETWSGLAKELSIPSINIIQLRKDHRLDKITFEDLLSSLLERWKAANGQKSTLIRLCEALTNCQLKDIADHVRGKFLAKLKDEFISDRVVDFQGCKTTVKELLEGADAGCLNSILAAITDKMISNGRRGLETYLVKNTVPSKPQYYIPRILSMRTRLKPEIFRETANDIFVFTGIAWNELSKVSEGQPTDRSTNQIRETVVRFILLEFREDFYQIQANNTPVHWIEKKEDGFHWKKSKGAFNLIHRHIHDEQDSLPEKEFVSEYLEDFKTNPICIADTPGMGKTLLLASIAQQVKAKHPNRLVFFITLRDFLLQIQKFGQDLDRETLIDILVLHPAENDLGAEILKNVFFREKSTHQVEIFLDGFDEINPDQEELTRKLFALLKGIPQIRLHVTTRPHMRNLVENTLEAIGYGMLSFTEPNQAEFLEKYWIQKYQFQNTLHLRDFAEKCLTDLKRNMRNAKRDIASIPQQCAQLGEVYASDAIKFSKERLTVNFELETPVLALFDMYQQLIRNKFDKLISNLPETLKSSLDELRETLTMYHVKESLPLLFPADASKLKCLMKYFPDGLISKPPKLLYSFGIMEPGKERHVMVHGGEMIPPKFVHRTFAEYFLAEYLVREATTGCKYCTKFLLRVVLGNCVEVEESFINELSGSSLKGNRFEHPVIAFFVNCHFSKYNPTGTPDVRKTLGVQPLAMLNACCVNELKHCYSLIESSLISSRTSVEMSQLSCMILLASHYSNSPGFMQQVMLFVKQFQVGNLSDIVFPRGADLQITPLHVAVHKGSYRLAEYFINEYGEDFHKLQGLLRFCTRKSIHNPIGIINEKVGIIKLILAQRKEKNSGANLWIQPHIHPILLGTLLEEGVDVDETDKEQNTLLHLFFEKLEGKQLVTPEIFRDLIYTLDKYGFSGWSETNSEGKNPLYIAVENINVSLDILEYFKKNVEDFNCQDDQGNSVLFAAIKGGRNALFIQFLMRFGCNVLHKNKRGQCALHVAAQYGNFSAAEFLVKHNPKFLNMADFNLKTPLHLAVLQQSREHERIQQFLIENDANLFPNFSKLMKIQYDWGLLATVNSSKDEKCKYLPLYDAFKLGYGVSLDVVKKMEEQGLDMDVCCSNILTCLIFNENIRTEGEGQNYTKLFRYFLEKGGKILYPEVSQNHLEEAKERLLEMVKVDEKFLNTLKKLSKGDINFGKIHKPKELQELIEKKKVKLHWMILSLLETNQLRGVEELRKTLQNKPRMDMNYVTAPFSAKEFLEGCSGGIAVAQGLDPTIFYDRVLECIAGVVEFQGQTEGGNMYVAKVDTVTMEYMRGIQKTLNHAHGAKFIIVGSRIEESVQEIYKVLNDHIEWSDLTHKFRTDLIGKVNPIGVTLDKNSKLAFLEILKGKKLVDLINQENSVKLSLVEFFEEWVRDLNENENRFLEKIASQHFYKVNMKDPGTDAMRKKLTKKGLLKKPIQEDKKIIQFQHECFRWYFAAKGLLRDTGVGNFSKMVFKMDQDERIKYLDYPFPFEEKIKITTGKFTEFGTVYIVDMLIKGGHKFHSQKEEFNSYNYLSACYGCNAINLIKSFALQSKSSWNSNHMPLLHMLVHDTVNLSESEIEERKELIEEIVNINKELLHKQFSDKNKSTPLLMPKVHVDLIKLLVKLGSDVKATFDITLESGDFSCTLAHLAAHTLPLKQFEEFVKFMVDEDLAKKVFQTPCSRRRTILHYVVERFDFLSSRTLELLASSQSGVNFNAFDTNEENVHLLAISMKRSSKFLLELMKFHLVWTANVKMEIPDEIDLVGEYNVEELNDIINRFESFITEDETQGNKDPSQEYIAVLKAYWGGLRKRFSTVC